MRTDFIPRFAQVPRLGFARGAGTFLLAPPTLEELGQIILRPAEAAGLNYETDLRTGQRLDEELRRAAGGSPGALPLSRGSFERMWQERDVSGRLTFEAYTRLGGLEGAIGQRAEGCSGRCPSPCRRRCPRCCGRSSQSRGPEGSAACPPPRTLRCRRLPKAPGPAASIDALQAPNMPSAGHRRRRVPVATKHCSCTGNGRRGRSPKMGAEPAHARSDRARTGETGSRPIRIWAAMLIPSGARLALAADLLERRGPELTTAVRDYVAASLAAHQQAQHTGART